MLADTGAFKDMLPSADRESLGRATDERARENVKAPSVVTGPLRIHLEQGLDVPSIALAKSRVEAAPVDQQLPLDGPDLPQRHLCPVRRIDRLDNVVGLVEDKDRTPGALEIGVGSNRSRC